MPFLRRESRTGPNSDDLHLDFSHDANSTWNRAVHDILLDKAKAMKASDYHSLEPVTDDYLLAIVEQRCHTLGSLWRSAQKRHGESGVDAATRWSTDRELTKKAARQRKRRVSVSCIAHFWTLSSSQRNRNGCAALQAGLDKGGRAGKVGSKAPNVTLSLGLRRRVS